MSCAITKRVRSLCPTAEKITERSILPVILIRINLRYSIYSVHTSNRAWCGVVPRSLAIRGAAKDGGHAPLCDCGKQLCKSLLEALRVSHVSNLIKCCGRACKVNMTRHGPRCVREVCMCPSIRSPDLFKLQFCSLSFQAQVSKMGYVCAKSV